MVKVVREHLSNPAIFSQSATAADNTMLKSTACAFNAMHDAAKRSGVTITINSAFRCLARQQYFCTTHTHTHAHRQRQSESARFGSALLLLFLSPTFSLFHTFVCACAGNCYITKQCNNGNLAAKPGTSNHGVGLALDLNSGGAGVYNWLKNNGHAYGFIRTVSSETWHWEHRPGSPPAPYT